MSIQVRPVRPSFAAPVTGVDLASPLPPGALAALASAIDRYTGPSSLPRGRDPEGEVLRYNVE